MTKIVVVGARGRIGRKLTATLRQRGHEIVEVSRSLGVDTVSGVGLTGALNGAEVVVDVSNSPSLDGADAQRFFEASGRNLLAAGRAAGVRHHVALSIVGVDRLTSGYFRAKQEQEALIRGSAAGFTILRSTQFFEFIRDVVQQGSAREIAIAPALVQPVSAQDVAGMLAEIVAAGEHNTIPEIAGAERLRLNGVAAEIATAYEDGRRVIADVHAPYFGAELGERSLLPGPAARIAPHGFDDWLRDSLQPDWTATRRADPPIFTTLYPEV